MAASTPLSHANMNVMNSSQPNSETGTATAAPVLDYACLFSHDLKRKQKRWQDGRLKFHCFNKRVMVYDERGNFIGDTHWTMDYDLDEGEEFQLARGCVVVQVSECLGRKEQDLSALIDQRYKDKEERKAHADAAAASKPYRPAPTPHRPPMPITQTMTTIATPRGNQLGRAILPTLSPFEQRNLDAQESAQRDEQARPAKRRKPEASPPSKSGYARSLFGAPLALSSFTSSAAHPSQTAPSRASDIRAIGREPLLPRSRPMPSLLKVQPTAFADTPSKAPKTTARSNPIIIADDTPETDSNHVHVDSAEPSVSLATIAGKSKARAGRSSNKPSHRDEHLAEEDGPPSSGEIIGARAVSPQLVAAESTLLQPRIAKRKTLLSVPRKQTGQPTHNQLESSTTARTDDQFSTADALDLNPRTSLVASTKRAKKRGLLIAAEKTTTRKRRRNVEDESGHDVAKSAYSVRAEEEEVVSEDKRRRKVSAGLMFDDDDVINVDSDATCPSPKLSISSARPCDFVDETTNQGNVFLTARKVDSVPQKNVEVPGGHDAESSEEDIGVRHRLRGKRATCRLGESDLDTPISVPGSPVSSSPSTPVEAPPPKRTQAPTRINRPHLATLRRSVKSKEIIGFYDSANSSREAAAIARMRESMTFASDEDEPAVIKQGLENGARRKEAGDEGRIQGQLRAREVRKEREEEDRQRQLRETQVQEESERKQREMEAREEAARQKRRQEKMALEEEKRRQEAREEEARQEELRRQQAREQETREKEARDEEVRRREAREDEARREALRQQQIREHEAREKQAREKQAREKQAREKQAREKQAREEELRRQEAREREAREAERRRLEAHEQELRRRKAREEELQQELIRERQAREREAKERRAREEEEQRQQELRQEQTREKEAQEREAKQKEEREREALAREVREREAREAEDRERKAREREARLEAREKEALEREARLEAREKESQLKEAREKEARAKQADAEKTRPKDVREKARLPKFVPPTRPSKLGGAVRASLSRAIPQAAGVRASTAARESTNLDAATRNRSAEEPTGPSSATLPVFTRANGGPWSIQAHDLLGIGRPS